MYDRRYGKDTKKLIAFLGEFITFLEKEQENNGR